MGNLWQAQTWHRQHSITLQRPRDSEFIGDMASVLIAQLFLSLWLNCRLVQFATFLEQPFGRIIILPLSPYLHFTPPYFCCSFCTRVWIYGIEVVALWIDFLPSSKKGNGGANIFLLYVEFSSYELANPGLNLKETNCRSSSVRAYVYWLLDKLMTDTQPLS